MNLPDAVWLSANFPELSNFQLLGQGGQKLVMTATHATEGTVVLKLIHPGTHAEAVRREILAVQQVQSPRVPRIMAHGSAITQVGPCIWLREQFLPGETLRQALGRGPLQPTATLRLGLQMMEALERAEAAQIVHRDVKPENIICDSSGAFWLLDFGIARHLDLSSLTATGLPFGKMTLGYAPPEQCRNAKTEIDSRADLFALGITLHECGVGRNGFFDPPPRDHIELLKRVERFVLGPINLPIVERESFRDLVHSLTQKNRVHRPRTVADALVWMREICARNGVT
jgi:serine/threonine protein kinase